MEENGALKQAEAHLNLAEAELDVAQAEERSARLAEHAAQREIEEAVHEIREAEARHGATHFTVDGEECETSHRELTANQIIREFGGDKDPESNYLVQIQGTRKISYQGRGGDEITLHDCMAFQIVSTGPKPVSDSNGAAAFVGGLRALGYEPQSLPNHRDHLFLNYLVETGRFAGQTIRLGLVVPTDFPNVPPSGPHVSPQVLPLHPSNDLPHPAGGVHQSPLEFSKEAGGEWQYWSRPFPKWAENKKTVVAYMSHIWRLWETQ